MKNIYIKKNKQKTLGVTKTKLMGDILLLYESFWVLLIPKDFTLGILGI